MSATTSPTIRRVVRSGDADLYVEQRGTGPDVLLLLGLGDTVEAWDAQVAALGDRYRFTSFDTRGAGRTVAPPEPITIPQVAADAAAVIEELGLEQPHVMGFSMGSMAAQELAITRPELVGSLVLCSAFAELDEIFDRKVVSWLELAAAAETPEQFLRSFLPWVYTREAHADGRVDAWIREMAAFEPQMSDEAFAATVAALRAHSTASRLGGIRVPTLLIAGTADLQAPPPYAREIASRIGGAEVVVMEGQAHQPFQEVPDEYNTIVTGFWERVGP